MAFEQYQDRAIITIHSDGPRGPKGDKGDRGEKGDPGEVTQEEFDDLKDQVALDKLDYAKQVDSVITKTGTVKPKVIYPENLQDVIIGKNIFNKDSIIVGFYFRSATGELIEGESSTGMNAISSYIPVEAETNYVGTGTVGVIFFDESFNYLSGLGPGNSYFKTPQNCKYIVLNLRQSEKDIVQIEKGSIRTSYEDFYYTLNKFRNPNIVNQEFVAFIPEVDGDTPVYYPDTQTIDFKSKGKAKIIYDGGYYDIPDGTTVTNDIATSARLLIFNTGTKNIVFFPYDKTINNNEVVLFGIRHYDSPYTKVYIDSSFPIIIDGVDNVEPNVPSTLPDYVIEDIVDTQNKVSDLQTTNSISFAFITDTHADGSGENSNFEQIKEHFRALKEMSNYGTIDFIVLGGDITSGVELDKTTLKAKLSEMSKSLLAIEQPVYFLNGNHDDNSYYTETPTIANTLRKLEWYNRVVRPFRNGEIHDTEFLESAYYYQDYADKKVRVVCLDGCDYPVMDNGDGTLKWNGRNFWGYGARQAEWLAVEALANIPEDYKVIVFSHMVTRHQHSNYPTSTGLIKNGEIIEGILTACHNGTTYVKTTTGTDYDVSIDVDFTGEEREVLAYIHGHNHTSTVFTGVLPFPIIGVPNSYATQHANATETRVKGTDTEDCWDIITIDTITNEINCTRYGAGEDRVNYIE